MRQRLLVSLSLVMLLSVAPGGASAADASGPAEKFSRGVVNSVTGLVSEVALNIFRRTVGEEQQDSLLGIPAGAVTGLVYGVVDGVMRTGGGIVDLFTFPVAIDGSYGPMVEPAFAF